MLRTVLDCIQGDHDPSLFWLAAMTCVVSVYASLWMACRACSAETGIARKTWAVWAASVFATGVWSTHFIAMNGYRPIHSVTYDGAITLGSGGIAVIGLLGTALLLGRGQSAVWRMLSGLAAAATVILMHYSGMEALRGSALIEYDMFYVAASMAVISGLFVTGFYFFVNPEHPRMLLLAGPFLIGGVIGLHFISMAGLLIVPIAGVHQISLPISKNLLGQIVLIAAILIPLFSIAMEVIFSQVSRYARREHQRMTLLSDAAVEGLMVVRQGRVTEVNSALCELMNLERDKVLQEPVASIFSEDFLKSARECACDNFCRSMLSLSTEEAIPVEVSHRRIGAGDKYEVFAVRDLREAVAIEEKMFRLAYTDAGTGAPNRRAFLNRIAELEAGEETGFVAVGIMDLDRFKDINDKYGHAVGDVVLQETFKALQTAIGEGNMAARVAGDEFGILLGPYDCEADIHTVAENTISAICQTVEVDGVSLAAGGSLGIAFLGETADLTLLNADRALYVAKKSGRGTYQFYDSGMRARFDSQARLETDLRAALRNGEFELLYQAEVLAGTMKVRGYEALLRWRRGNEIVLSPEKFLPIAEDTGLIDEIGDWVLMTACLTATKWPDGQFVAVNVSARQLLSMHIVEQVAHALSVSGLEAARLQIEVTETALFLNSRLTREVLMKLKALGVGIALDDFGTGYSSISHLHNFPVDTIKIDRSFVQALPADKKAIAIVDAVCRLGINLGITIVAEGVETKAQIRYLSNSNCTMLQGYLLGKPVPECDIHPGSKPFKQSAA